MLKANIQEERSKGNPIKHEKTAYTFSNGDSSTLGCGDIGILHNIAILFKMKNIDTNMINRFHIIVRTMRRSPHWDWVKPEHINIILRVLNDIHEIIDNFILSFKQGQEFLMESMTESVEKNDMSEGDYIEMVNGLKEPYKFITGSEFKEWVAGRAKFYQSLNGEIPKISLISLPQFNNHDGKCLYITK